MGEQDLTECLPSGHAGQRTRTALRLLDSATYRLQNRGNKARMSMKTKDKVKMSRNPDGKEPLTWLATLATLSPKERAVDDVRSQYSKIVGTKLRTH